jgi:3-hydroxybutyryl-CoA dehydratase
MKGSTMQVGDVISWQRTFTEADIRLFATISGDEGEHHLVPDEQGRLLAQRLINSSIFLPFKRQQHT